MSTEARIGLFLGGQRGCVVLEALIAQGENVQCVCILKQDHHELENFESAMVALCNKNGIAYVKSHEVQPQHYHEFLKSFDLDMVFVVSWRYLIPEQNFKIPQKGIYVVHDSLLPKNRGFAPTNWCIINGEQETGLTLFQIAVDVDSGDIVDQVKVKIADDETATTLNQKFLKLYPAIIINNISRIFEGHDLWQKQDHSQATYLKKRKPADGKIDFSQSAQHIERLVRGLSYPYPGAFFQLDDGEYIIWEAKALDSKEQKDYGEVLDVQEDYLDIQTQQGILRVFQMSQRDNPEERHAPKKFIYQPRVILN